MTKMGVGRLVVVGDDSDTALGVMPVRRAFPGDGDPDRGWISADSPLGAAVLGCEPGDRVEVAAPAGRRVVTVLSIE